MRRPPGCGHTTDGLGPDLLGGRTHERHHARRGNEPTTHHIPGWDRPKWALHGHKDRDELTWIREASVEVIYSDGGGRGDVRARAGPHGSGGDRRGRRDCACRRDGYPFRP
jgi:hypothetical protein